MLIFEVFLQLFKSWSQNSVSVEICVDLNPCSTKIRDNFQYLQTAAHTMRENDFCQCLTFLTESQIFVEDFAYILSFWLLSVVSIVMGFSSEKKNNDLSLCQANLQFSKKTICSSKSFVLLSMCEVLSFIHLGEKQLEIVYFFDVSHYGHARIHVFSHLSCRSLRISLYSFLNSFNILFWSISAWSSIPRTVFRRTKLLKSVPNNGTPWI